VPVVAERSLELAASASWAYPLIMFAALLTGAWLLKKSQRDVLLTGKEKFAIAVGAFCGAMIGAKLPFALSDWDALRSGAVWFSNGKTIVCGMVGAYIGVEITKWIYDIRVKTGDSFAVPAAVAVGIGRLSCFVAGCCYGTPTTLPWGVRFSLADAGLVPRHPTQLYESAFHLALALLMFGLRRRGVWRGQLVKFYILTYLVYRWFTEFIRPEPELWAGWTGYQWFAIVVAPLFGFLWWYDARHVTVHLGQAAPST
jgi:phosphatidylglycerol---prolipoprotein diacylglyceryl transferase